MASIEQRIDIAAPPIEVWAQVAALDRAPDWNRNLASVSCSQAPYGVGTTRTCSFNPTGSIDELVTVWEEPRRLTFSIGAHGGIRSADSGFALRPIPGGTEVTAHVDYHLAFGPLGPVIDKLTVRRQMGRMLADSLVGLKHALESEHADHLPTDHRNEGEAK